MPKPEKPNQTLLNKQITELVWKYLDEVHKYRPKADRKAAIEDAKATVTDHFQNALREWEPS